VETLPKNKTLFTGIVIIKVEVIMVNYAIMLKEAYLLNNEQSIC
jgi:hypothetical protein